MIAEAHTSDAGDRKWKTAFMVLSLDHAGPFWAEMGLELAPSAQLQTITFEAWQHLQTLADTPSTSPVEYQAAWQSAELERLLNDEQLDELTRWQKHVAEQHRVSPHLLQRPRFVHARSLSRR